MSPPSPDLILVLIHLTALMVALGGNFFLVGILFPLAKKNLNEADFYKLVARVLRRFHPIELLSYGILMMTGFMMITRHKIAAGTAYFDQFGAALISKLGLAFLVFMIASGKFFGVGTRIVYLVEECQDGEEKKRQLPRKMRSLQIFSWVVVALLLWTAYAGLKVAKI